MTVTILSEKKIVESRGFTLNSHSKKVQLIAGYLVCVCVCTIYSATL